MEHTNRTIRPLTQQDLEAYLDIYLNAYPLPRSSTSTSWSLRRPISSTASSPAPLISPILPSAPTPWTPSSSRTATAS